MGAFVIEYEPQLVEEAVLCALRGRREEAEFRTHRDPLYELPDPEAREAGFRAFHALWFKRLGLGERIEEALQEQLSVAANVARCLVASAASSPDERAELFVSPENGQSEARRRTVLIRLTPETLALPDRLRWFLRRELLHIADMLDPRFDYRPWLPPSVAGPAHGQLVRDRYRVLWDAYVDGRLARAGRARAGVRAERLSDFARAFPMPEERTDEAFAHFFEGMSLTHSELMAFAIDPEPALGQKLGGPYPGTRCPLCGFPTHAFEPAPDRFSKAVVDEIQSEFPGWTAAAGLCVQCADLYRSRSLSLS